MANAVTTNNFTNMIEPYLATMAGTIAATPTANNIKANPPPADTNDCDPHIQGYNTSKGLPVFYCQHTRGIMTNLLHSSKT